MKRVEKRMSEMSLEDAFKLKRDIGNYVEKWENTKPEDDPMMRSWRKHIDESKILGKKRKASSVQKEPKCCHP